MTPINERNSGTLETDNWHPGKAGWPVLLGVALILMGGALLVASAYLRSLAAAESDEAGKWRLALAAPASTAPQGNRGELQLPPYAVHLSDLDAFLRSAPPHGVALGSLTLRSEQVGKATVTRHLEVQVDAGYESLKRFVADVLARLPNAFLDEIRIEQMTESGSARISGSLKVGMAYRLETAAPLASSREAR